MFWPTDNTLSCCSSSARRDSGTGHDKTPRQNSSLRGVLSFCRTQPIWACRPGRASSHKRRNGGAR